MSKKKKKDSIFLIDWLCMKINTQPTYKNKLDGYYIFLIIFFLFDMI